MERGTPELEPQCYLSLNNCTKSYARLRVKFIVVPEVKFLLKSTFLLKLSLHLRERLTNLNFILYFSRVLTQGPECLKWCSRNFARIFQLRKHEFQP